VLDHIAHLLSYVLRLEDVARPQAIPRCHLLWALSSSQLLQMQGHSVLWSKPHYACDEEAHQRRQMQWLQGIVQRERPDFIGLSQYERAVAKGEKDIHWPLPGYSLLGSGCYASERKYGDVIGLAYDTRRYILTRAFPVDSNGGSCEIPSTDANVGPEALNCPSKGGVESICCACTGDPYDEKVGTRAFVVGNFHDTVNKDDVCVIAANLPHPYPSGCDAAGSWTACETTAASGTGLGLETLIGVTKDMCQDAARVIFLGDTNLSSAHVATRELFGNDNGQLSQLADAVLPETTQPSYTCCADTVKDQVVLNRYASDRIAMTGDLSEKGRVLRGGAAEPGGALRGRNDLVAHLGHLPSCSNNAWDALPCCASPEEHAPLLARFF